jgi:O-succinylbenzoate synthase
VITVSIKWSAVKVTEAMDKVDFQLNCAQPFIDEALARVREARQIPDLAGYMDERLARLELDIREKFNRVKAGVESVRKAIPEGAIEEEQQKTKHGSTQSLI